MKLHSRLILVLGGSALAAFLLMFTISFTGIQEASQFSEDSAEKLGIDFLKKSAEWVAAGDSAFLENRIDGYFSDLEYLLNSPDPAAGAKDFFKKQEQAKQEIDSVILSLSGNRIVCMENPARLSKQPILRQPEYAVFLHQIRKSIAAKTYSIYAAERMPGVLWIAYMNQQNGTFAVFRVNGNLLLSKLPGTAGESAVALAWARGMIAVRSSSGIPEGLRKHLEEESAKPSSGSGRRVTGTNLYSGADRVWCTASAVLTTFAQNPVELHIVRAVEMPDSAANQITGISGTFRSMILILLFALLAAVIFFAPFLIISARNISEQLESVIRYLKDCLNADKQTDELSLKYSEELKDLSSTLNLFRDKLRNAMKRLSRSHERELLARKEAEDSNFLRSGLLGAILSEIRDPLTRIDGFSDIAGRNAASGSELALAAEAIRNENKKIIAAFQSLSDLAALDPEACELGTYEIEPAEILRDASNALNPADYHKNISVEVQCAAQTSSPMMTSPSVLTHIVYLAASVLAKFAPDCSCLRLGCREQEDALIFSFSDQPSADAVSIAEVFQEYAASGIISAHGCGVAILNLMILKTEASFLGAQVRIERTDTANSLIEIHLPMRGPNPAVTGVFMTSRVSGEAERTATSIRLHLPEIPSASVRPQTTGGRCSVLLTNLAREDAVLFRMTLASENCDVETAEDSEAGMERLNHRSFDVILLDMTLEQPDNFILIARLRKIVSASARIYVLTDSRQPEYVEKLLKAGADFCFRKPIAMKDLLEALRPAEKGM